MQPLTINTAEIEAQLPTQETAMGDKRVADYSEEHIAMVIDALTGQPVYARTMSHFEHVRLSAHVPAAIAKMLRQLRTDLTTAQARIAEIEGVLKWHHDWHLQVGDIGLPDGEGGWIGIDNSDAYSDSLMCEKTTALLAGVPSEVLPRGGVNAHWWQISILQRRRIKELEASRHADRVAGVKMGMVLAASKAWHLDNSMMRQDKVRDAILAIDAEAAAREIGNEE